MLDNLNLDQALALVDNAADGALLFDEQGRVVAINGTLRRLLGAAASDRLLGRAPSDLTGDPLQALLVAVDSFAFMGADRHPRYFAPQDMGLSPGTAAVRARLLRDVTDAENLRIENERLRTELAAQALYDPITGLLNRRGLMVALEPQVSRSRRYNSPLSLVIMDVYGVGAESEFLVRVSQMLKDQLRWADMVGCTEDREFIMVLPETHRDDALSLTEKLTERLAREIPESTGAWAAYGVVEWQKTDNSATLLRRAQAALAQARTRRDAGAAVAL